MKNAYLIKVTASTLTGRLPTYVYVVDYRSAKSTVYSIVNRYMG